MDEDGCRSHIASGSGGDVVAVVGGGCAGVLAAAHLLRSGRRTEILIFEPRLHLGAGVAYSTDDPAHLLNTPACAMSAYEDRPDDFVAWLAASGTGLGAADFAPRRLYARYLRDVLRRAAHGAAPGATVTWVSDAVTDIDVEPSAVRGAVIVRTAHPDGPADGQAFRVDHVVLAVGAPPPTVLSRRAVLSRRGVLPADAVLSRGAVLSGFAEVSAGCDVAGHAGLVTDPWRPGALDAVPDDLDVLLLGTGLTMVDVAVSLARRGSGRRIVARSRRGLLPAVHTADGFTPWPGLHLTSTSARGLLREVRGAVGEAAAAGADWRNVVAAVRTSAPDTWGRLSDEERRRLLRHAGRRWEVARHRLSAPVAASIAALVDDGVLEVGAGAVESVRVVAPRALAVTVRRGRPSRREVLQVGAVVDCTGPGGHPAAVPLVGRLITAGVARVHPTGLGLAVDEDGALTGVGGGAIVTMGWCRRGAEFEATAVPELRRQAARLASHLDTASRVGTATNVGAAATGGRAGDDGLIM